MSTPEDAAVVWVTTDDLADVLGTTVASNPTEADRAVAAANLAVHHRLRDGEALLFADNALLQSAALTAAVDLYRRPKTAAGVYQVGELYARLPASLFVSIDAAIIGSGADMETGCA